MEKIQGYLKSIVFETNGFLICKFLLHENIKRYIFVKGYLANLSLEQLYELTGNFIDHPKYGKQFEVTSYNLVMLQDDDYVVKYLSSPLFPTIGKLTAQKIVDRLKNNILETIYQDDNILYTIGISKKQAAIIYQKIKEQKKDHQLTQLFSQANLSLNLLAGLQKAYPETLYELITTNPYKLIDGYDQWTFNKAEQLRVVLNIEQNNLSRLVYALQYLIREECFKNGHSFVSRKLIMRQLMTLCPLTQQIVQDVVLSAINLKKIVLEDDNFYDYNVYFAELNIAKHLYKLQTSISNNDDEQLRKDINVIGMTNKITYNDLQVDALIKFMNHSLTIINGGPGTGKTTLIKGIIELYKKHFPTKKIAICAPTGRAAKRLKEQTKIEATTIHKLLKWDLYHNKFNHHEKEPLEYDLIVVDEMSMVDTLLFNSLLKASPYLHKLLLVGDNNQLPSVNSGNVLGDLLKINALNIISLEQVYRQQAKSNIIKLAYEIQSPDFAYQFRTNEEVFFSEFSDSRDLLQAIATKFLELVRISSIFEVQVLASMYNGRAGINAINSILQAEYNPACNSKAEVKVITYTLRVNDKVMQTKNNSEKDVYNGDIGIITNIIVTEKQKHQVVVQYEQRFVTYEQNELSDLILAYAISVHKSQGSEYSYVMLVVDQSTSYLLSRNLVYTAITRCQKQLHIFGQIKVFNSAIKTLTMPRKTSLDQRLKIWY